MLTGCENYVTDNNFIKFKLVHDAADISVKLAITHLHFSIVYIRQPIYS